LDVKRNLNRIWTMNGQGETMAKYLEETKLCDWRNPELQAKVMEVTAGADTFKEKAVRIFYYVRDSIRFSLAYSRSKASQTLKKGYGECGTKTNLQVGMLRAVGIAARYRWVEAESVILEHLVEGFVYKQMPPKVSHFWCECFLDGKWISCEALLDRALYEGMLQAGLITEEEIATIDWDGERDLVLLRRWITKERGVLASYDDVVKVLQASEEGMPPIWLERVIAPVFYRLNLRHTEKIRRLVQ